MLALASSAAMRILRALAAGPLLFLGCAKASSIPAKSEASNRALTAEEEAFRRVLAHGCTGFKECDDLYIKVRRRAAECSEISSCCLPEREDLATATKIRDDGFERALQQTYRDQFIAQGEFFRRVLTLRCEADLDCAILVMQAHERVTECVARSLDCTRDRENEVTAIALMDAERQCEATPACVGARIAKLICEAKEEKRDNLATLAQDKDRPAAEIDWLTHYELIRSLPESDEEIANLQKRYAAATRKSFNDKLCGAIKAP